VDKRLLPALFLLVTISVAEHQVDSKDAGQKCAFISEVSGKVLLQRNGKYYLLSGMEGTYCGEAVKVLPRAKAVVAECTNNLKFEIPGPAEFTVAPPKLVFKSGKAKTTTKIDPDLCPFFMEEAFNTLKMYPEVDANGNIPPERVGTEVIYKPNAVFPFNGYVADIKGDVYFAAPEVRKLTGDVVIWEGTQIFARTDGALSIYSCGQGKKYRVEGPAVIKFNETGSGPPVGFLRGKAPEAQPIDPEECWNKKEAMFESGQENFKPVGLDGK
jgi:hypothetical protein